MIMMLEFATKKAVTKSDVILKAMWDLGGRDHRVSTRQIAKRTGFSLQRIAQILTRMPMDVDCHGGKGGDRKWQLKTAYAGILR